MCASSSVIHTMCTQFLFLDRSVANMGAGLDLILISSFGFYSLIFHRWSVLFRGLTFFWGRSNALQTVTKGAMSDFFYLGT